MKPCSSVLNPTVPCHREHGNQQGRAWCCLPLPLIIPSILYIMSSCNTRSWGQPSFLSNIAHCPVQARFRQRENQICICSLLSCRGGLNRQVPRLPSLSIYLYIAGFCRIKNTGCKSLCVLLFLKDVLVCWGSCSWLQDGFPAKIWQESSSRQRGCGRDVPKCGTHPFLL